jgi:hypothetical protein
MTLDSSTGWRREKIVKRKEGEQQHGKLFVILKGGSKNKYELVIGFLRVKSRLDWQLREYFSVLNDNETIDCHS